MLPLLSILLPAAHALFTHPSFPLHSLQLHHAKTPLCGSEPFLSGYFRVGPSLSSASPAEEEQQTVFSSPHEGVVEEENEDSKYFYTLITPSQNNKTTDPIILWLNGGPGCSSLTGAFFELGPCRIANEGKNVTENPYAWNRNATIVFLDQPVNVGFSYGSPTTSNSFVAADDVYAFLQLLLRAFPDYADNDFHVAGESYAGHYIPVIGQRILQNNKGKFAENLAYTIQPETVRHINLDSLMIGNGLTDALTQYDYYVPMVCDSKNPLLSTIACTVMKQTLPACRRAIAKCYQTNSTASCISSAQICNAGQISPYALTGRNPYDIRRQCTDSSLCYPELTWIDRYLNDPAVQYNLSVHRKYQSCNMVINQDFFFHGDWMRPFQDYVAEVLEQDVRVLIYAGDQDFICNWMGNNAWTLALKWSGQKEFVAAPWNNYTTTRNVTIGEMRQTPKFSFVRLFDAGHMVPYDQPENSLQMLTDWLAGV